MKKGRFFPIIALVWIPYLCIDAQVGMPIQSDSPETLQWVQRQSERIDSMLTDAMRGSEPIEILIRVAECYQIFDAVSMAGVYYTDVRGAAEAGRWQCDVINYRLEKDLNCTGECAENPTSSQLLLSKVEAQLYPKNPPISFTI
jgi:hypothetical protein